MPGCLEARLSSLTAAERASVVWWLDYGRCAEDEMKEVLAGEADVVQTMHNERAQKLFLQQQEQFRWAARDNVIIAKCVSIAEQEGMPPAFAWLAACMALLAQNNALTSTAQAPPTFTRAE